MGSSLRLAKNVGWNSNGAKSGLETGTWSNTVLKNVGGPHE